MAKVIEYHELFEHWYKKVSRGGRLFTRYKARPQIITAHGKHVLRKSMDEEEECVETLAGLSSNTLIQTIPNASLPGSLGGWIRT